MKLIILTAFFCFSSLLTYSQHTIQWNENQQLTWEDFAGKVNDSSRFDAECFAEIRYNYKFHSPDNFEFDVCANFNKNTSWTRIGLQSNELLKHEQMHFNIAELFAKKLKRDFDTYSYTARYNMQILQVFDQVKIEYQAMQLEYDEETNHSLNKVKQKEWEDFIKNELRKTRFSLQIAQNIKQEKNVGE